MKNQWNALLLSAALAGLTGGTTVAVHAQTNNGQLGEGHQGGSELQHQRRTAKHSCKGKNDCKGQGGCKSSDNGCKGKNSCKGKGGCATDGSKMPTNLDLMSGIGGSASHLFARRSARSHATLITN